jgi:hypothetical protein
MFAMLDSARSIRGSSDAGELQRRFELAGVVVDQVLVELDRLRPLVAEPPVTRLDGEPLVARKRGRTGQGALGLHERLGHPSQVLERPG